MVGEKEMWLRDRYRGAAFGLQGKAASLRARFFLFFFFGEEEEEEEER